MAQTNWQPAQPRSREGASQRVVNDNVEEWHARATEFHDRLERNGNTRGALACAAATLERLHRELGAPPMMDRWIDALDRHLTAPNGIPWPEVEPFVFQAGVAVLGRRPAHPALPLWHARGLACLRGGAAHADDATRAANFSFEYAVRGGNFPLAREIVQRARARGAQASADVRAAWHEAEALEAWLSAEHDRARRAVVGALAAGGGYAAWEQGASAALSEGDLAHADVCLAAMARTLDARRTQDVAHGLFLAAARAHLGGENAAATQRLDECLRLDATNVPAYFTVLWRLGRGHVAIASGRFRRAGIDLGIVLAHAARHYWCFLQFSALMSRTWLRIRQQRPIDALEDLHAAFALARTGAYRNCDPWWDPEAIDDIGRFARDLPHDRETLSALVARAPLS